MKMFASKWWIGGLGLLLVVGGVVGWKLGEERLGFKETAEKAVQTVKGDVGFMVTDATPGHDVFQKMQQGCPLKDCMPALTHPQLESREKADRWLGDDDIVLGIDVNGEQRAYPQKILNWHEIVDDRVKVPDGANATSEMPIAVTYAPLTGSALVFDRQVGGKILTFGVSGKVYNSNTVMYDRETQSLWQQFTGEAVVGTLQGKKLTMLPVEMVAWKDWKAHHPHTLVLSRSTGYQRDYTVSPYGTYETDEALYYPVGGGVDKEISPKTVVYGIMIGEDTKAYTLPAIERQTKDDGVLNDTFVGKRLRISYAQGKVWVENITDKNNLVPVRAFWFAWKAFNNNTELYNK